MEIKVSTLLIISLLIIATIIGVNFWLQPIKMEEMITEREFNEITNAETKSELEEKINMDLQGQEKEFEQKINDYISQIYFGTETYLPEFDNINSANEQWIWECAYRNLANFQELLPAMTISKEAVEKSAKQLFGNDLQKEFPKEGLESWLEPEGDGYLLAAASIEPDFFNECEILSYKKNGKDITVNVVEYKYNQIFLGEPTELELYNINSDEIVKSYSLKNSISSDDYYDFIEKKCDEAKKFVKENTELFSTATITLEYDEQADLFHIKSCER